MAKTRLTIADKLLKRQYKIPSNFIWFLYGVVARSPFFGPKYHVTYKVIDDINQYKGPAFLVWNHLSRRDYLFLKNLIAPHKFNMLAGYQEFFRRKFDVLFKLAQVIPKKNFTNDPKSIRAMDKIIRSGGTIALSPEGMTSTYGHNQPIVPGTGRFFKHYHVPVYFMKLEGAYLTSPKSDIMDRYGKINATLSLLFSSEDLLRMSPQEIDDKLNEAFRHDDFKWNKIHHIKYNSKGKIATGMEDLFYKCPRCGEELTIEAHDNIIRCTACGNETTIDDYYDLHPLDESCKFFDTLSEWGDWQRVQVIHEIRADKDFYLEEEVEVGELPKYQLIKNNDQTSVKCGKGVIRFDHYGIHFNGVKNNEPWTFDLSYSVIYSLIVEKDLKQFGLPVKEEIFEFYPKRHIVAKILLVTEEMHRLHFNTWKNFPWNDYMYEGTELEKK